MFSWREDESNKDAYMYLRNGLFFTVRPHSFYKNTWQASLWLKTGDNRQIEIHDWDIEMCHSLEGAKKVAKRQLKQYLQSLVEGIEDA